MKGELSFPSRSRIANEEMRVVMESSLQVSQVQTHLDSLVVAHTYGLGNAGDAPSRNEVDRIQALCRALGIRCQAGAPSIVGSGFRSVSSRADQAAAQG